MSKIIRKSGNGLRTNSKGELHCFLCRAPDHWAHTSTELTADQQGQLHMNLQAQEDGEGTQQEEGHQLLNMMLAQGGALLMDDWAYLDGCLTVTAFKNDKYLKGIKNV